MSPAFPRIEPATGPSRSGARWRRWRRRLPWLALTVAFVCLSMQRAVEVADEFDCYPDVAVRLARGVVIADPFHPFGYPLAIAILMAVVPVSPLVAGCLVSAIAAIAMVWATGQLADRLRPGAGWLGCSIAATHGLVWVYGTTASSDMTAASLGTVALALAAAPTTRWSNRRMLVVAFLLGTAVTVRYAATPMAALVLLWILRQQPKARTGAALAAGLALGLLPQAVLDLVTGNAPFHNENWQNLYLQVACGGDAERLLQAQQNGTLPTLARFVSESWPDILAHGCREAGHAFGAILPRSLRGTRDPTAWMTWWTALPLLLGAVVATQDRRVGRLLLGILVAIPLFASFTFLAAPRLMLPVLPILLAGLAVGAHPLTARRRWGWPVLAALAAALLYVGQASLCDHFGSQPIHLVKIAQSLPERLQRPLRVLTTYRLLDNHVPFPCAFLMRADFDDGDDTWQSLRERLQQAGADVLIVGAVEAPRLHARLTSGRLPADFQSLYADGTVFAAEFRLPPSDWLEALQITPTTARIGASIQLQVVLGQTAEAAAIASVGVTLRSPSGSQELLDLPASTTGYRRQFVATTAGTWIVQPILLRRDGQLLRGAPREVTVAP